MSKNKFDFLNEIFSKVQDIGTELQSTAVVSAKALADGKTTFTVDTVKNFTAGCQVFIYDGTSNFIRSIFSTDVATKKIVFAGDLTAVQTGASIVKTISISQINEALNIYSKYSPLVKTKEYTGTNSDTYDLPEDWLVDFSLINFIEYPVKQQPRAELSKLDYEVYLDADDDKYKVRFISNFSTGDKFRLNYTAPHSFNTENNNVTAPDGDFYCICNIGAYLYLIALASAFVHSKSSSIDADTVNYQSKSGEARRIAKEYLTQVATWLGVSVKSLDGSEISQEGASLNQEIEIRNKPSRIFG